MRMRLLKLGIAFFLLCVPASSPLVLAATPPRTLAIVDFPVRVPAGLSEATEWLGPALSELLQAKMQLFQGVRVLERMRVRALLREARTAADAAEANPAALSGIVPAEVLIAGSVSVDPKDPSRIRVQARAFEVETSTIVSEATFSGTGDLAGLLRIAEDLAKTLVDGLKLTYTPDQLAYAEPAQIDALRFFVKGEADFAAGRHREAITSLQQALEGNAGRYYPAAHLLQGEAYQALASDSEGEGERRVREEYLKKFKEDAVAAAGALYDLGLAYEANEMWKDAVGAFEDYIAAVGKRGETVRWRYPVRAMAVNPYIGYLAPVPFLEGTRAVHFLEPSATSGNPTYRWVTLDAGSGKVTKDLPVPELPCAAVEKPGATYLKAVDISDGRALLTGECSYGEVDHKTGYAFLASLDASGAIRWRTELEAGPFRARVSYAFGGLAFVQLQMWAPPAAERNQLVTLDEERGTILSRIELGPVIYEPLRGLDLRLATLVTRTGTFNLRDGTLEPRHEKALDGSHLPAVRLADGRYATSDPEKRGATHYSSNDPRVLLPAGPPGVHRAEWQHNTYLFHGGKEVLWFKDHRLVERAPSLPRPGPLVLSGMNVPGGLLVNTGDWSVVKIYQSRESMPFLKAQDENYLVFAFTSTQKDADTSEPPAADGTAVLHLMRARDGEIVAKYRFTAGKDVLPGRKFLLIDGDIVLVSGSDLVRVRLTGGDKIQPIPSAEAQLRIAGALLEEGDAAGALKRVAGFEAEYPKDPRSLFVRMKIAARTSRWQEAEAAAMKLLGSGSVAGEELGVCLSVIRKVHPEVRDALKAPGPGWLLFHSAVGPGVFAATRHGRRWDGLLYLVDLAKKNIGAVTPRALFGDGWTRDAPVTPGQEPPAILHYAGRHAYGVAGRGMEARQTVLHRIDLLTGESTAVRAIKAEGLALVRGMKSTLSIERDTESVLLSLDPESLDTVEEIVVPQGVGSSLPDYVGGGIVIFADNEKCRERADAPLVVLDRDGGRLLGSFTVHLENEKILAVGGDRSALTVVVTGGNWEQYLGGDRGIWFRVESIPLDSAGTRWEFAGEGLAGGNPVIEGDTVVFPAFEGKYPSLDDGANQRGGMLKGTVLERIPLKKIVLDRHTGERLGDAPLAPEAGIGRGTFFVGGTEHLCNPFSSYSLGDIFSPAPPRRIFPGRAASVRMNQYFHEDYWWFSDRDPPVKIVSGDAERDCQIIPFELDLPLMLSWNGTVLESIGGGVILVKDLAGGRGLQRLSPVRLDRGN